MIMLCYIHQAQKINTSSMSMAETVEQGVKYIYDRRQYFQDEFFSILLKDY